MNYKLNWSEAAKYGLILASVSVVINLVLSLFQLPGFLNTILKAVKLCASVYIVYYAMRRNADSSPKPGSRLQPDPADPSWVPPRPVSLAAALIAMSVTVRKYHDRLHGSSRYPSATKDFGDEHFRSHHESYFTQMVVAYPLPPLSLSRHTANVL